MGFSISFDEDASGDLLVAVGRIELDTDVERFESRLTHWSKGDYEKHWLKAAAQVLAGTPASFVVDIDDPLSLTGKRRRDRRQDTDEEPPVGFVLEEVVPMVGERWMAWPDDTEYVTFRNGIIVPGLTRRYRFHHDKPEVAPPRSARWGKWRRSTPPSEWTVAKSDLLRWWEATSAQAAFGE